MMPHRFLRACMPGIFAILVALPLHDSPAAAAEPETPVGFEGEPSADPPTNPDGSPSKADSEPAKAPSSAKDAPDPKAPTKPDRLMREGGAKTFKTAAEGAPDNPDDPVAMLARCDTKLEQCKTDHIGMPYLITAYLALWAILVGYFVLARRGQQKLESEVAELRQRLRDYEEAFLQDHTDEQP